MQTFHAARYLRLDVGDVTSAVTLVDSVHILSDLGRQLADLVAPIGCLQFHGLGNVLRPCQPFR